MLNDRHLTRYSAFAIHLATSLAIFLLLAAAIIFFWFPGPLFQLDGGWKGLRLVAFVDVVLGPLLTLIVYKPGKPGLKIDMGIIVTLQLVALGYGVWTLDNNRPALLVFADDSLQTVPLAVAQDLDPGGRLLERFPERPARVMVQLPADITDRAEYILKQVKSQTPLHHAFRDYAPMTERWQDVIDDSLDIESYVQHSEAWQTKLHAVLTDLDETTRNLVFLPIKGRNKSGILIATRDTGEFVGHLDIPYDIAMARKRRLLRDRL